MSHADFVTALKRIGTFVDISENEFLALRTMMREEAARRRLKPKEVRLGSYYSNGADGVDFCVRRVVDQESDLPDGRVIWRVVAGLNREQTGISTRNQFANWACCEVQRAETAWMRKPPVVTT